MRNFVVEDLENINTNKNRVIFFCVAPVINQIFTVYLI